jgi:two-component system sensor histidine kinase BaeS
MPREVPLRRSLLIRLLATSILIAVCSIAATAWLAVKTTSKAIQQEQGQVVSDDASVYDTLVGYAALHPDWSGVGVTIRDLAQRTGRHIILTGEDRKPVFDSAPVGNPLPSKASAVVDPLRVDPALIATAGPDRIDPRAIGPFTLPQAESDALNAAVKRSLDCLTDIGVIAKVVTSISGRPRVEISENSVKNEAYLDKICAFPQLLGPTPTEQRALSQLDDLVNGCLHEQGAASVTLNVDFTWMIAKKDGTYHDDTIQACLDSGRRAQLKPYVAPAVLLFLDNPPGAPTPGFDLSTANTTRIISVAALVLALAVVVTVLVATRLVRPLRALTHAAQQSSGQAVRAPVTTKDEIGYLAQAFNDLSARRERTEDQRKAMVSDIAHELRSPLTNIRGWLEAAEDGLATQESDPALMSALLREAMLLQHIIDDLQDLADADAGILRLHRETIRPGDIIEQVVTAHRGRAEAEGVTLTARIDGDPELFADPVRLHQAVGNLVSNAVRHTPSGGSVTAHVYRSDDEIVIEVADTGSGIAAEDLPKVFDRFWRAEKSRNRRTGGSGLGLAIVRQLAQAHGGTVSVASEPGAGAVFTLRLPVA